MGINFCLWDDNVHPHRENIVNECLQSEDITRMGLASILTGLESNGACGICLADELQPVNSLPPVLPELQGHCF
ncbi:DDE_3 domain-containing protein [Trichonephila clavipes]|nr:DDE_3 domain-containing protein [Trichonephila clavipes]